MASLPTRRPIVFKPTGLGFLLLALWIGFFVEIKAGAGDYSKSLTLGNNSQRPFDYFMLSFLWPPTSCRSSHRCCPSNACCHSSNVLTEFTIHGLWTNYNDGTWPACCSGKIFNVKEVSSLLGTLNKYWPSLSCDSLSNCHGGKGLFWEHEWEKHGTCSYPVIRNEYDYFVTTLNLYFKYNVTEVLKEAGYVASSSEIYPLGGIISAIQNAFHATPQLVCSGDNVDELRLCFYKDLKPRDCALEPNTKSGSIKSDTPCPRYVRLPEIASSREFNFLQVQSSGYSQHDTVNIVSDE